jgi:hypothetical protein
MSDGRVCKTPQVGKPNKCVDGRTHKNQYKQKKVRNMWANFVWQGEGKPPKKIEQTALFKANVFSQENYFFSNKVQKLYQSVRAGSPKKPAAKKYSSVSSKRVSESLLETNSPSKKYGHQTIKDPRNGDPLFDLSIAERIHDRPLHPFRWLA